MGTPQTFTDVPCTVCGCVCDDLTLQFDAGKVVAAERACGLARSWFERFNQAVSPGNRVGHKGVPYEDALEAATRILKESRAPLIYGLSRSSTPGQRAAVALAEALGGTVDTTASICHGPSIVAIQQAGESTSTLGEVRQRSDLVLFWGGDPAVTHPRHFERYSVEPASDLLPRGRADRKVVVIDSLRTETAQKADQFIQVDNEKDFEMIWALRQLVRDPAAELDPDCGVPLAVLRRLATEMRQCRYGAVFFGLGLAQAPLGHETVDGLLRLVAELNAHTRFVARRLRIPGDVSGADSVLCWQTGFPFGVNFATGYPRYNPGEFTAEDLLCRGEVDACLLVGAESISGWTSQSRRALTSIPTILLDIPQAPTAVTPSVRITTAVYGIHAPGTIYRMDEVPLPLRKLCDSDLPTDETVLKDLLQRVTS